jgi:predicted Zn-dependent peptidase
MQIPRNKQFVLKNGLRVLFLEKKEAKTTAFGLAVNAGPYYEEEGESGISHLLEHVIGRLDVDNSSFREKIYKSGGLVNAATSVSQTFYHLYTFSDSLIKNCEILVNALFFPKFTSEALSLSRESVLSEMAFGQDFSPYEVLRSMMWKDARLARSIVGTKDSLLGVDIGGLKKYHAGRYVSNNSSVVVIGESFPGRLVEVLEKIPPDGKLQKPQIDISLHKPGFRIFQERNLHSTIAFSFPTKGYLGLGEERHLFNIAATALNDFYISSLGKSGLVYEANWNWNVFPESGDFIIYLESLEKGHVVSALEKGLTLICKWPKLKLGSEKFNLIREHIILNLNINTSLVDSLTLLTKNFSSSEEAHTYEGAVRVYEGATLKETILTTNKVLLSQKPYVVVSLGADSLERLGKINQVLADYYNEKE